LIWFVTDLSPDLIDVVKDQPYGADYIKEEDPKIFISNKTHRGPLSDNWLDEYWNDVKVSNHQVGRVYIYER
jgi:hypothetical protein